MNSPGEVLDVSVSLNGSHNVFTPKYLLCSMMQFRTMSSGDVPVDIALGGAERRCEYRGGPN